MKLHVKYIRVVFESKKTEIKKLRSIKQPQILSGAADTDGLLMNVEECAIQSTKVVKYL